MGFDTVDWAIGRIWPVKSWVLVCWWWQSACLMAPVVTGPQLQLFIGVVPSLLLPFPFPTLFPLSFPSSLLFHPLPAPTPKIQLGSLGECCKLPQWVRAERGRQTHFGAIEGQNFGNHVNKLACSQHMPINIMLSCAVGEGLGTPWNPFGYGPVSPPPTSLAPIKSRTETL